MVEDHVRAVTKCHENKEDFVRHKTIFSEILESNLPASEKGIRRLRDEAGVLGRRRILSSML